jgi:hypothetical protein
VVGENDIKYLFIYSIDDFISGLYRYQIKLNKGWYRVFIGTPCTILFFV